MKKSYKIGVDARTIFAPTRRGIGKTLVEVYRRLAICHDNWEFLLFFQYTNVKQSSKNYTNVKLKNNTFVENPFENYTNVKLFPIDFPGDRWNFWEEIRLPLAAKINGIDILHCPANTAPRYPCVPMVVTIHDLIPLEPEFSIPESERWGESVSRAVRKACRIITPSGYTRDKIVQRFGVEADKLIVNHWAPDSACREVRDPSELARVKVQYGLRASQEYVLGFGAADPRKNTERILLSWKQLPKTLLDRYVLLLVGIQDSAMSKFRSLADKLELRSRCVLKGYAAEEDLPALLSGAEALCYPSLSEGFGLPILDAFVCQTPVLTSTTTSLPEVAGEAAVLVEPTDPAAIAGGLCKILEDKELREKLVRFGSARLENFTWEACVERVGRCFEEALE
ncbi:MAG: glycosyltransferase family 4 protein [Phycisphaerae bacterium]|jgi:glycosyltransferase involved in cell wall biosynthesis|nr:glycosyltransferase family 4 protein [Phycisphaerae bacterium]